MDNRSISRALFSVVCFTLIAYGSAGRCERENIFGIETYFDCPQPGQPEEFQFCCGDEDDRRCCAEFFGLDKDDIEKLAHSIPKILGILFGVVFFVIILCVVCCCCCPFCLLAKKRKTGGGAVHRGGTEVTVTVPASQPLQPYAQQQGYQPQPGYPGQPQPGYPMQPQPGYPMQPQPGYPMQPQPGYPTGAPEQPPPYSAEKQPAFNPNYGA